MSTSTTLSANRQKGFATILIVLVGIMAIVGVAGGAYYLGTQKSQNQAPLVTQTPQPSPATDETVTWKTYTNPLLKYEIKYPTSLSLDETDILQGKEYTIVSLTDMDPWAKDNILVPVSNCTQEGCDPELVKGFILKIVPISNVNENFDIMIVTKNPVVKINNAEVYKSSAAEIIKRESYQNGFYNAVVLNTNHTLRYDLSAQFNADRKEYFPIFDQILSTFKFLDQKQSGVMEMITVAPCDFNADGQCDTEDQKIFNKSLGKKRGEVGYSPFADADINGVVDDIDLQLLFPETRPTSTNN